MRRWNGWGDEKTDMVLPATALKFLSGNFSNEGLTLPTATLAEVCSKVVESRLPQHPLLDLSDEARIRHARGQSLPDWLAMKSGDFGPIPDGVAFPVNAQQIQEILTLAASNNWVVIPYGGGTSVAGHINPKPSSRPVLTVDLSRMNRLIHLDKNSLIATFGAGTPGPMVESQLMAQGYTLGHFPQSFELSTIGGWVASRSCGQQSLHYGRIEQLFVGGKVETLQGTLTLPNIPASAAGPDLREWVLGSEGRIGIISEVSVRISPLPKKEKFKTLFFPTWQQAKSFCQQATQNRFALSALRLSNAQETDIQLNLAGHENAIKWLRRYLSIRGVAGNDICMVLIGFTGTKTSVEFAEQQVRRLAKTTAGVSTGTAIGGKWSENRFRTPYLREALWQQGLAIDTLETAIDWTKTDQMVSQVENAIKQAVPNASPLVFTHLSHMYRQGCSVYTSYIFPIRPSYAETLADWQQMKNAASELIVNSGGTISHQHGVGKDHAKWLVKEKQPIGIGALDNCFNYFDPDHRLNPGTLIEEKPLTETNVKVESV